MQTAENLHNYSKPLTMSQKIKEKGKAYSKLRETAETPLIE